MPIKLTETSISNIVNSADSQNDNNDNKQQRGFTKNNNYYAVLSNDNEDSNQNVHSETGKAREPSVSTAKIDLTNQKQRSQFGWTIVQGNHRQIPKVDHNNELNERGPPYRKIRTTRKEYYFANDKIGKATTTNLAQSPGH
jgi:hypothetical protein